MPADGNMHELLPWYTAGMLEAGLAGEFREHLSTCEPCRREMAMLEDLRLELERHGPEFLDDHLSPEQVVAAARGELEGEQTARARRHIALCSTCAEEAGWVTGEGSYADAPPQAPARGSRPPWAWAAAVAAVLVLAAIPLLLLERPGVATGAGRLRQLEPAQRGAEGQNVFRLAPDEKELALILSVDLPESRFPLEIVLIDETGRTVASETGYEYEWLLEDAYMRYRCALSDCAPGKYTLQLYGPGAEAPELEFGFEVAEP